jgi:hypothetical protein
MQGTPCSSSRVKIDHSSKSCIFIFIKQSGSYKVDKANRIQWCSILIFGGQEGEE